MSTPVLRTVAITVAAALASAGAVLASDAAASAAACVASSTVIVAHEDDDILFMNPDIQGDLDAGKCVTTVYVTAGDGGGAPGYWNERESGPVAAYSTMLGLADASGWQTGSTIYAGRAVVTRTSPDGRVHLVYLRLPDGSISGSGFPSTGNVSLARLWSGRAATLSPLDGTAPYTYDALSAVLSAIAARSAGGTVRVQDTAHTQGEHSDHVVVGQFGRQAAAGIGATVVAYRGYSALSQSANVDGADLTRKTATVLSYAAHDPDLCSADCTSGVVAAWTARQHTAPLGSPVAPVAGPAPYDGPNVARNALVLASSAAPGQAATAAIDGVVGGWPGSPTTEWSSNGQRAGAWLTLTWTTPQHLDRIHLHDRPNGNDRVTGATLTFDDGTTLPVPELANNGNATIVTFPARTVTSIRLTITAVSPSTENIGLAEISASLGDPAATPGTPPPTGARTAPAPDLSPSPAPPETSMPATPVTPEPPASLTPEPSVPESTPAPTPPSAPTPVPAPGPTAAPDPPAPPPTTETSSPAP